MAKWGLVKSKNIPMDKDAKIVNGVKFEKSLTSQWQSLTIPSFGPKVEL